MCLQACEFQLYEPLVKSRTRHVEKTSRRRLRDSPNVTSPRCDIHPVRSPKRLDETTWSAPIPGDLVVLEDHFRNFRCPLGPARSSEVGTRQSDGRRQIVEGAAVQIPMSWNAAAIASFSSCSGSLDV
jgi:hypothetical protein